MRRQVVTAIGISIALVIIGYILFSFLFSKDTDEIDSDKGAKKSTTSVDQVDSSAVQEKSINVVSVEGKVKRRKGEEPWSQVKIGDVLEMDETIQAEDDGRAVMDFEEAATVEISPNSDFTVKEISSSVSRLRVNEGRVTGVVHGKGESKLIVEAKGSDAVAESSQGRFSVLTDGMGQVAVASETARVTLSANDEAVVVTEGMQSVVLHDSGPTKPETIPQTLFLKVAKPKSLLLREKQTSIEGTATPGAVVSINNVRIAVDKSGSFRGTVPLDEGKNKVVVAAEDAAGQVHEHTLPPLTVDTRPPRVKSAVTWGED